MKRDVITIKTVLNETVCFAYGISVPQIIYHDLGFEK